MKKSSESFKSWAKMVAKDLTSYNPPSTGRIIKHIAAGSVGSALATYIFNRVRKRKTRARQLILSALAGGIGGAGFSYYRSYMDGKPFDNSSFDMSKIRSGDRVYLGIAGSANGEGNSWFGDSLRHFAKGRAKMFRHVDIADVEKTYKELKDIGAEPVIIGHSSGGKHAANFLAKHPEATGYLIDPVSWFGKKHPRNATAFTADISKRHGGVSDNYIADIGGRWNLEDAGTYIFSGSHSNKVDDIISDFILRGYTRDKVPENLPSYITVVR